MWSVKIQAHGGADFVPIAVLITVPITVPIATYICGMRSCNQGVINECAQLQLPHMVLLYIL